MPSFQTTASRPTFSVIFWGDSNGLGLQVDLDEDHRRDTRHEITRNTLQHALAVVLAAEGDDEEATRKMATMVLKERGYGDDDASLCIHQPLSYPSSSLSRSNPPSLSGSTSAGSDESTESAHALHPGEGHFGVPAILLTVNDDPTRQDAISLAVTPQDKKAADLIVSKDFEDTMHDLELYLSKVTAAWTKTAIEEVASCMDLTPHATLDAGIRAAVEKTKLDGDSFSAHLLATSMAIDSSAVTFATVDRDRDDLTNMESVWSKP